MSEHTEGPWDIEKEEVWAIRGKDGGRIATLNWLKGVFGGQGRRNAAEVHANAYLISAAPAMLEALEPFAHYIHVMSAMGGRTPKTGPVFACHSANGDAEITVEDRKRAVSALAQARGEGGGV